MLTSVPPGKLGIDSDEEPSKTVHSPLPPPASIPTALTAPYPQRSRPVSANPDSQPTTSTRPQRSRRPPEYFEYES